MNISLNELIVNNSKRLFTENEAAKVLRWSIKQWSLFSIQQPRKTVAAQDLQRKFLQSIRIIVPGSTNGELIHFVEITDHAQGMTEEFEDLPLPRTTLPLAISKQFSQQELKNNFGL